MVRGFLLAAGMTALLCSHAVAACDGQAGNVIFEDTFPDDSGGWDMQGWTVQAPELIGLLTPSLSANPTLNATFNASEGDYCARFKLPAPPASDNQISVGLIVLAADYNNYFLAQISTDGGTYLYKRTAGAWSQIFGAKDTQAVKLGPDAENEIRVTVAAGRVTMFVNGKQLKTVRAQMPPGALRFGLYVQSDKSPAGEIGVHFKDFYVLTGS